MMEMYYEKMNPARGRLRMTQVCVAAVTLALAGGAMAFEIPTGNDDFAINWDNTLRYTLAQRLNGQSSEVVNSANHNDGDRNFDVGIVSSRIDLLSEADVVYRKNYGVRVSAAGWYDPIYNMRLDGQDNSNYNHLVNGASSPGMNASTKNQFAAGAELLDAFAFGRVDISDVQVNVRVGRHTIYWGEAFFPAAGSNGISYGQSPIDMAKALAMPGVELKEIFRPLNQVSFAIQPTNDLTIAGQWYLQWEHNKFPEPGSYLGMIDSFMNNGEFYWFPDGKGGVIKLSNTGDHAPKQVGDFGLKVAYSPEWLNGTLGLHYRNFSDKMAIPLMGSAGYYNDFATNIDLYGLSFAKQFLGISVGSELSYRHNMALTSQWFAPTRARGDTMHAVVNFLGLLPKTPLFDTGTVILEFAYGRWINVNSGSQYFTGMNGTNSLTKASTNQGIGAATRDNSTVTLNFVPEWKQVLPGIDLAAPMNFSIGMHGNAATLTGGTRGTGSVSGGLSFDIFAKYKVDLTYARFFGKVYAGADGGIAPPGFESGGMPSGQGASDAIALLRDRDLLSLTMKATF